MGLFLVKSWALPEAVVRRCSIKKCVSNNFTGKRLCWSLFFDKAAGWRSETLLEKEFSADLFLCIIWSIWCELLDISLLLVDIFWYCSCCWHCHIKFLIKFSLTPFSWCWLPFFRMFVYILLKFNLLINFFSRESTKKIEISKLFFAILSSAWLFKRHDCAC